jgi:hypothetical protein
MVLGIQIMGILFGAALLYFTFLGYKKKELRKGEFLFWGAAWIVFIYLVLFPNVLDFFVESLNLVRTLDFFTIVGFMVLIALTFYNYIINMKNRSKLERAVRAIAMDRATTSKKTKK